MSWEHLEVLSIRPHPSATTTEQHAAVRAVLHRVDTGQLTRTEAWTCLAALGLIDYPGAGKVNR